MIETMKHPARGFVQAMKDAEGHGDVLSMSLIHGFPWGDVEDLGARMLAIVDGDRGKAQRVADEFANRLWQIRENIRPNYPDIEEALDAVADAHTGPVVLADMADNPGAGAPGDSNYILRALLDRGMRNIALAVYWDPVLVAICKDGGIGAQLCVRVGGKVCARSGDPIDLDVVVRGVRDNMIQKLGETEMDMGTGVWLEVTGPLPGLHLIISTVRTQCFSPTAFTDLGLDITSLKALVVKSANHFYAAFLPVASGIVHVRGPGVANPDVATNCYTKSDGKFWPRVENPFPTKRPAAT